MAEKKKRGPGRPTKYNAALGTRICKRVANGETLREIAETPGMPCESTIRLWAVKLPGFSEEYARARELQADAMADEAIAVARRKGNNPIGDRLLVDTLKWAASKLKPRSYSDRPVVVPSGGVPRYLGGARRRVRRRPLDRGRGASCRLPATGR